MFKYAWLEESNSVSGHFAEGIADLLRQLSSTPRTLDRTVVEAIGRSPNVHLLLALREEVPVGMLTLATLDLLSGRKAVIEDVVVDAHWRGKGVAETLVRRAVQRARNFGAQKVDLTSRPDRLSGNRLYEKCGFERRETNSFRLRLPIREPSGASLNAPARESS